MWYDTEMHAKRGLGQNFLVGSHYSQRILDAVAPRPEETIVEIGPGRGALTKGLVESGARIIAVEFDSELTAWLRAQFQGVANFHLVEGDALAVGFGDLIAPAPAARVVANLPYNISTPILQRLIGQRNCLREMTLMLQREVVERIVAEPGGREYGYLSVLVQFHCQAERLFDVPPGAFRPAPKVWSSVLRLRVRPQPAAPVADESRFLELTRVLFAQRRKTIFNNLRAGKTRIGLKTDVQIGDVLDHLALDPRRRAETLAITEIAQLADALHKLV
jgi:16S rRNA (adenine1518-N6/adenine1519-N6)-dimethyltransferase